jgi:hypothetical protein
MNCEKCGMKHYYRYFLIVRGLVTWYCSEICKTKWAVAHGEVKVNGHHAVTEVRE